MRTPSAGTTQPKQHPSTMTSFRKWIALFLLAVFLPATAFAQACATHCTPTIQVATVTATVTSAPCQHCAPKKIAGCGLSQLCEFAQLATNTTTSAPFNAVVNDHYPTIGPADFVSITHPPALRPPAV